MPAIETLWSALAGRPDGSPALAAPGHPGLSHGGLRALIQDTVGTLNSLGIGRGDRVAEIPKGATGKLQRIGLAAKLGLTA